MKKITFEFLQEEYKKNMKSFTTDDEWVEYLAKQFKYAHFTKDEIRECLKDQPRGIRCLECGEVINADYNEFMLWCGCGSVGLDSKLIGTRYSGSPDNYELL